MKYTYVKTDGSTGYVDAPDPTTAIRIAPNRDPHSGVQIEPPPGSNTGFPSANTNTSSTTTANTSNNANIPPVDRTVGIGKLTMAQNDLANSQSLDEQKRLQAEADLYASQRRQARIDAINTAFAPRVDRQNTDNAAALSRVDALNFNRGIVGSGADTTKIGEQKNLNDKALRALEDEKAIMINDAFTEADKLATDRAALLSSQSKNAAQANVDLYTQQAEKATSILQSFGKTGKVFSVADIKNADPNAYNTLRDVLGYSDAQMMQIIDAAKPVPTNVDTKIENGYLVASYYDPATKKFVATTQKLDLPADAVKANLDIVNGKNGLIYVLDKNTGKVVNTTGERDPGYGTDGNTEDPKVISELQTAQAAIAAGANSDDVRRTFLDLYPKKGDLFLKYTKQAF